MLSARREASLCGLIPTSKFHSLSERRVSTATYLLFQRIDGHILHAVEAHHEAWRCLGSGLNCRKDWSRRTFQLCRNRTFLLCAYRNLYIICVIGRYDSLSFAFAALSVWISCQTDCALEVAGHLNLEGGVDVPLVKLICFFFPGSAPCLRAGRVMGLQVKDALGDDSWTWSVCTDVTGLQQNFKRQYGALRIEDLAQ